MARNVLHILGTARREGTGIARMVAALAAGLDPNRYKVHAWFLAGAGPLSEELEDAGASVQVIDWSGGWRDPLGAWTFWRAMNRQPFALVHQHFGNRAPRRLARLAGSPKIIFHAWSFVTGAAAGAEREPISGADLVIATSQAVADGIAASPLQVVYPGVDLPEEPRDDRAGNGPVLGMAGRLVGWKGTRYLIGAMSLLRDRFPLCRLEIAGTGPEEAELKEEVARGGLADRVRFLGWQPQLSALLSTWDIYVQPSLGEPFGIAALEAMAAGLPVVATSRGGIAELVDDGRTGRLVPPGDAEALAAALCALLSDPAARRRMGAAARTRARDRFATGNMVGEISLAYDRLLNGRNP